MVPGLCLLEAAECIFPFVILVATGEGALALDMVEKGHLNCSRPGMSASWLSIIDAHFPDAHFFPSSTLLTFFVSVSSSLRSALGLRLGLSLCLSLGHGLGL